jgi:F-type H+-transporting ATPase subunit delta
MAEVATIARPYAEAFFKALGEADAAAVSAQLETVARVAAEPQVRQFADNPKVSAGQVLDLITAVVGNGLDAKVTNLLRAVIDNGRLAALPEIAAQFHALVNRRSGTRDATIHSAFPMDAAALDDVLPALEKRFGGKLVPHVVVDPSLIGGIRVVVGDEVLDTSVRARLQQMKVALTA